MNKTDKKLVLIIGMLMAGLLMAGFVSARQDKVLIKKCVWSYENTATPSFPAWNGDTGVFLEIVNNNPSNFSGDESPLYNYVFHSAERDYWYDGITPGTKTKIPILDTLKNDELIVGSTCTRTGGCPAGQYCYDYDASGNNGKCFRKNANYLYINCSYLGGPYNVYEPSFYFATTYYATDDFALTTLQGTGRSSYTWSSSPSQIYPYSYFATAGYITSYPTDSLSDPTVGKIDMGAEFSKTFRLQVDNNPTISKSYPSSLFQMFEYTLLSGETVLSPQINVSFYVKSEKSPAFCHTYINNSRIIKTDGTEQLLPYLIERGDSITGQRCISFTNTRTFSITGLTVDPGYRADVGIYGKGGIGNSLTDVSEAYYVGSSSSELTKTIDIEAGRSTEFCLPIDITLNEYIGGKPAVFPVLYPSYDTKNSDGESCGGVWPAYGSDGVPYLAVTTIGARIVYNPLNNEVLFNSELGLEVSSTSGAGSKDILPNPPDYNLSLRFYDETLTNLIYETEIVLDEDEFEKMGKTCPGTGCKLVSNEVVNSYSTDISLDLKDDEGNFVFETGGKYEVKFCMKRTADDPAFLKDKVISCTTAEPVFEYGDIIYNLTGDLFFTPEDRDDVGKVRLFNPSFKSTTMTLSPTFEDPDNFEISFEGGRWIKNGEIYTISEDIPALGYKDIDFTVRAIYPSWPVTASGYRFKKNLEIEAAARLLRYSGNEYVYKTSDVNFNLNVQESQNVFNLFRNESIASIMCVDEGDTDGQEVGIRFMSEGIMLSGYNGKPYKTKITLKTADGTVIGAPKTKNSILTSDSFKTAEELIITENLGPGDYILEYAIDFIEGVSGVHVGALDETKSGFIDGEPDNFDSFNFRVPRCTIIDSEKCVDFGGLEYCNTEHDDEGIPYSCAWECNGGDDGVCPLPAYDDGASGGYRDNGACQNCQYIIDKTGDELPCYGYNNEQTCDDDPCKEADRACSDFFGESCVVGPHSPSSYSCKWAGGNDAGKCLFYYNGCDYGATADGSCSVEGTTSVTYEITGTPLPGTTAVCINKRVIFPCPRTAKLPGFGITQMVVAGGLIMVIYVVYLLFYLKRR